MAKLHYMNMLSNKLYNMLHNRSVSGTTRHGVVVQHVVQLVAVKLHYTNKLYNLFVSGKTTSQHLDMSRCWDVTKFCRLLASHQRTCRTTSCRIVVTCPLVMLYNLLDNMFV